MSTGGSGGDRKRSKASSPKQEASKAPDDRPEQLRLAPPLEDMLGQRYCATMDDLASLLISSKLVSKVATFEVQATLMGDSSDWMAITLDAERATAADVKIGIERLRGIRPATQELYKFDEEWTGTVGSGGSGHTKEQEDKAFVEDHFVFRGPCRLQLSVNENYDVILEGQQEGDVQCGLMGVYERVEGREVNGRGV